nr:diguanylate cyclase [Flexistipes sinusarabici]
MTKAEVAVKKYILIADPSKVSRFVLENYLKGKYKILTATSYSEAKDILDEFLPSLVIISYELQDGVGLDLCEYMQKRKKFRSVPVIVLTSNENDETLKFKAFGAGAIDFLEKSKVNEDFVKYVDEIVEIISISDISGSSAWIVDNDIAETQFLENILKSTGITVSTFSEPSELLKNLKNNTPDIIIADLFMKKMDGMELTKELRHKNSLKNVPILILASSRESSFMRTLLLHGANDYILKPFSAEEAILRVTSNIKTKKLYDDLEETNRELFKKATTDSLTGLYNRRFFMEQLEHVNYNAGRYGHSFGVALWDIDHFKNINDRHGHDVGDRVLIKLTEAIKHSVRKSDIIGRFGGEEFICIFPGQKEADMPAIVSKLLEAARDLNIKEGGKQIPVTISIGAVFCKNTSENLDNIIKNVDKLMYRAKSDGRNKGYISIGKKIIEVT